MQLRQRSTCIYCEREFKIPPTNSNIQLKKTKDHLHPSSMGGNHHYWNIVEACNKCNSIKSNLSLEDFREKIKEKLDSGIQKWKAYTPMHLQKIVNNIPALITIRDFYIKEKTSKSTPTQGYSVHK